MKPQLPFRLGSTSYVYPADILPNVRKLAPVVDDLEQDELDVNITAKLPGSVATFAVPDGFLLPGTEYELGLGTVTDNGNISFVETTFTTAGNE